MQALRWLEREEDTGDARICLRARRADRTKELPHADHTLRGRAGMQFPIRPHMFCGMHGHDMRALHAWLGPPTLQRPVRSPALAPHTPKNPSPPYAASDPR